MEEKLQDWRKLITHQNQEILFTFVLTPHPIYFWFYLSFFSYYFQHRETLFECHVGPLFPLNRQLRHVLPIGVPRQLAPKNSIALMTLPVFVPLLSLLSFLWAEQLTETGGSIHAMYILASLFIYIINCQLSTVSENDIHSYNCLLECRGFSCY